MTYLEQGTTAYRKSSLALFAGAFVTFAILYSTQPLLPEFTREFNISPTLASLSLSVTTITLAVFMLLRVCAVEAGGEGCRKKNPA